MWDKIIFKRDNLGIKRRSLLGVFELITFSLLIVRDVLFAILRVLTNIFIMLVI